MSDGCVPLSRVRGQPRGSYGDTTPLPREEQERLAVLAKRGEAWAIEKLVASNMRWIWIRSQAYRETLDPEDALQEGVLGFIYSLTKFVKGKSSIQTYSDWWIRSYVQRAARSASVVKVWTTSAAKTARTEIYRAAAARNVTPVEVLSDPEAVQEIADCCNIGAVTIARLVAGFTGTTQIHEESFRDTEPSPSALDVCVENEQINLVQRVFEILTEEDALAARVLQRHLESPTPTLEQLGKEVNLSRERVRQLELRAKERFRELYQELSGEHRLHQPAPKTPRAAPLAAARMYTEY